MDNAQKALEAAVALKESMTSPDLLEEDRAEFLELLPGVDWLISTLQMIRG